MMMKTYEALESIGGQHVESGQGKEEMGEDGFEKLFLRIADETESGYDFKQELERKRVDEKNRLIMEISQKL